VEEGRRIRHSLQEGRARRLEGPIECGLWLARQSTCFGVSCLEAVRATQRTSGWSSGPIVSSTREEEEARRADHDLEAAAAADHRILVGGHIPAHDHILVAADSNYQTGRADHLLRNVSELQIAGRSDSRCLSLSLSSRRSSTFSFSLSRKPILANRLGTYGSERGATRVERWWGGRSDGAGQMVGRGWCNDRISKTGNNERRNVTSAGQGQTGRLVSWLDSVRPHLKLIRWQYQWGVDPADNRHSLGSALQPLETAMPRSTSPLVQTYISRSCMCCTRNAIIPRLDSLYTVTL
jgi:hypothetical protein